MPVEALHELQARTLELRDPSGRRIVGLCCAPPTAAAAGTVVIAPGYQRGIQHGSVLSRQLVRAGFRTVRFDLTDHVGLSDGNVRDFTLSSVATDVRTVLAASAHRWPGPLHLIASSLAARAAVRALARDSKLAAALERAVLVLPVIDAEHTLTRAIGTNVLAEWRTGAVTDRDELCDVLGHQVRYRFCEDALAQRLDGAAATVKELTSLCCAVTAIAAERDDWVRLDDVHAAMGTPAEAERETLVIEASSHDLAHNPPAMRLLLDTVLSALAPARVDWPDELTFEEIVETVRTERGWKRERYAHLDQEIA
ncbi:MAG: hypothetical protein QOJ29_1831 [Thermoleophilaceae bacterium]|jgi:acyl transferase|nr:hypothetical protein [Thermoleophilaceae bacterium]